MDKKQQYENWRVLAAPAFTPAWDDLTESERNAWEAAE